MFYYNNNFLKIENENSSKLIKTLLPKSVINNEEFTVNHSTLRENDNNYSLLIEDQTKTPLNLVNNDK